MAQTEAPSIAPATGVGAVHLALTDAAQALTFYEKVLGLRRLDSAGEDIRLGAAGKEVLVLHPGASEPVVQHRTGLYHFALVVPTQRDLAVFIARLMRVRYSNSPTDHVLTKADYLWDPDGNGIEVYTETPEDGTWFFDDRGGYSAKDKDGRRRSGRDPIDLEELFSHLEPTDSFDQPLPAGTKMGHVHLHVADVGDALDFYHGLVGFDVMGSSERFGMAFVSAGGYHHHIGLNTWAGRGVPPAPEGTSGLRLFTIEVPDQKELETVHKRLDRAGVKVTSSENEFEAADPSHNLARFVSRT